MEVGLCVDLNLVLFPMTSDQLEIFERKNIFSRDEILTVFDKSHRVTAEPLNSQQYNKTSECVSVK